MKRKYYWDSSAFLAWLQAERGRVELADSIVSEVQQGKAIIITSVMASTEIFEGNFTQQQERQFKLLMGRRDVTQVNVDHNVSDLARQIREHYKKKGKKLSTPDATHLATAIIHKADEFHTFDEDDLLKLNWDFPGYPLKICKPESAQKPFAFPGPTTQN